MIRVRHQQGCLYKQDGWWYLRYRDNIVVDGAMKRTLLAKRLVPVCDQYRTEGAVRPIADEFMLPINRGVNSPQSAMTFEQFVDEYYLPYVKDNKRPSTYKGYRDICNNHLKPRCGKVRLREFRTCNGERLLREIERQKALGHESFKHIKSVLSAVFKHAKRQGALDGINPVQDVSIPDGVESRGTEAFTIDELGVMLNGLPEPANTVVACAGMLGPRKGEVRGLRWEDFSLDGQVATVAITRSAWYSHVTEPKSVASKAVVPIAPELARRLRMYRELSGNPVEGYLFAGRTGKPLNLDNLASRVIRPFLEKQGMKWKGWHAFRRGLASEAHARGHLDKTIQQLLRHADVGTTMNCYVKALPKTVIAAVQDLDVMFTNCSPKPALSGNRAGVN